MEKIYLQDILPLDKLSQTGKVLLIRHYHKDLDEMLSMGLIEEYQSFQRQRSFREATYLISFLGKEKNTAQLYGVYKIKGLLEKNDLPNYSDGLVPYCKPPDKSVDFQLQLEELPEFAKFKNRLIIDWVVPRGWYNTYGRDQNKPVIRILPYRFVSEFPGLMNIKISFSELKAIVETPDSHEEWYNSLTRLQAVYLILNTKSGEQYVGTTFGKNGLWQRWESYVSSGGTGGNKRLIKLKDSDPEYTQHLQFSILEVLTRTADKSYCIHKESLWKEKLGSRAFGLNEN